MSEQPTAQSAPILRLQKMYLKDLSFENPNAPDVFFQKEEPKVQVELGVQNRKVRDEQWEVTIKITANVSSDKNVLFIIELEHAAVFLLRNIPEEHVGTVLGVDCPTLLFPFTRQIMCQASLDGGFMPFLLDPVNFAAVYENAKKAQAEQPKH